MIEEIMEFGLLSRQLFRISRDTPIKIYNGQITIADDEIGAVGGTVTLDLLESVLCLTGK